MKFPTLSGAIALAVLSASAQAATLTYSDVTIVDTLDFEGAALDLVAFNPDYGRLEQVSLALTAAVTISAGIENDGPAPARYSVELGSLVTVTGDLAPRPGLSARPSQRLTFDLPAYDGAIDFAGSSGVFVSGERIVALGRNSWTDTLTLDAMTGTDPLLFHAEGLSQINILGETRFAPQPAFSFLGGTAVRLAVTYTYTPATVAAVPLPAGVGLLGLGLGLLGATRRRT